MRLIQQRQAAGIELAQHLCGRHGQVTRGLRGPLPDGVPTRIVAHPARRPFRALGTFGTSWLVGTWFRHGFTTSYSSAPG
jgi:hypothetical protein